MAMAPPAQAQSSVKRSRLETGSSSDSSSDFTKPITSIKNMISNKTFTWTVVARCPEEAHATNVSELALKAEGDLYTVSAVKWNVWLDVFAFLWTHLRANLRCEIDAKDPIWSELPNSVKLWSLIDIGIVLPDGSTREVQYFGDQAATEVRRGLPKSVAFQTEITNDGLYKLKITVRLFETKFTYADSKFESSVCSGLLSMLEEGKCTDLTVVAKDGTKFKAHKLMLAARSPVFKAMLTGDNVEARTGIVKMDDISGVAVQSLLRYLYGGKPPMFMINEVSGKYPCVSELIHAADKYMLHELKESFNGPLADLCSDESPENAVFLLKLGKLYSLEKAHVKIKEFIQNHPTLMTYIFDCVESCECATKGKGMSTSTFDENERRNVIY